MAPLGPQYSAAPGFFTLVVMCRLDTILLLTSYGGGRYALSGLGAGFLVVLFLACGRFVVVLGVFFFFAFDFFVVFRFCVVLLGCGFLVVVLGVVPQTSSSTSTISFFFTSLQTSFGTDLHTCSGTPRHSVSMFGVQTSLSTLEHSSIGTFSQFLTL